MPNQEVCTTTIRTEITNPQIYILKQNKANECYYTIFKKPADRLNSREYNNGQNEQASREETNSNNNNIETEKLMMSYHKLFVAKDVSVIIYDGEIEQNKPLRALVGHQDWNFDSTMQNRNTVDEKKLNIYNVEGCAGGSSSLYSSCFIESNKVTAMDHLVSDKFSFYINTTKLSAPYNMLINQNEFTVNLYKSKHVPQDNSAIVVVIAIVGALTLFGISVYCFIYKKNMKFGSVVDPNGNSNGDLHDNGNVNRSGDDNNGNERQNKGIAPADKKLIDLATTKYVYKLDIFKSILQTHDDRCCPICILQFEEEDAITMLPCSHLFHSKCVTPWLSKHQASCPMCKLDIVITALQIKQHNNNDTNQINEKLFERYYAREFAFRDAENSRKNTNHSHSHRNGDNNSSV